MENYTYEKKSPSNLMPEGDYEVILERMDKKTLSSGKEKISIMYRVRGDIEGQSYGNKCLFEDIWQEKENPQFFNRKRLNQLLGTQEFEDGTVFGNINEVIKSLVGSRLIIHVKVDYDDYRDEDVNRVAYYKSSKHKPQKLGDLGGGEKPVSEGFTVKRTFPDDEDFPF